MDPSDFLANPIATPTAKIMGRLLNRAAPALPMISATRFQPNPSSPSRSAWPKRNRIAAAGSTAIGSMRLRPIFCRTLKACPRRLGAATSGVVALMGGLLFGVGRRCGRGADGRRGVDAGRRAGGKSRATLSWYRSAR